MLDKENIDFDTLMQSHETIRSIESAINDIPFDWCDKENIDLSQINGIDLLLDSKNLNKNDSIDLWKTYDTKNEIIQAVNELLL